MNTSDESRSCAPTSLNVGETKSIASRVKFAHFGLVSFTMLSLWMGYCGTARSMSMIYSKNFENSTVAFPVEHRNQPPAATTTTTTSIKNVSVEREPTAAARTRNVIAAFIEDEAGKTTTSPASSSTELPHTCGNNSELWLRGPRYDNLHDDPYLTDDVAKHMILNIQNVLVNDNEMSAVLGQSICHADSRFLNSTQPTEKYHNDRTVRLWAVKLTYLALHYHQHRMAAPEAVARYSRVNLQCPSAFTLKQEYGVGVFDYECPDAKYIITSLSGIGLGANVRAGMVVALLVGLISDRIVIFVNNAARGVKHLKGAWPLASCPRKDYQCFFWPTTPCTLTFDEIDNAYELTRIEYRKLTKENKELKSIEHHKVWYFQLPFTPLISLPTKAAEALYKHALTLISAVSETENPQYVAFLRVAAEAIRTYDGPRAGYNYAAASLKVHHALSFYSMRPNPRMAHELDRYLTDIIPRNFTPETSVGLPIRGTSTHCWMQSGLTVDNFRPTFYVLFTPPFFGHSRSF